MRVVRCASRGRPVTPRDEDDGCGSGSGGEDGSVVGAFSEGEVD